MVIKKYKKDKTKLNEFELIPLDHDENLNNLELVNQHDLEIEKTQLIEGMCFGEWALMYNIPRTASAYTVECDLFYLDKEYFDITFHRSIVRADIERKNFLIKKLPTLKHFGKVEDYLKKIMPVVRYIYIIFSSRITIK